MAVERVWVSSSVIRAEHANMAVMQIYCWAKAADDKIVLVSKDAIKWQFPGGHPEAGETHTQTLVRELLEEAGLDITSQTNELKMFGYYYIQEDEQEYLQVRYKLDLAQNSDQLCLCPQEKAEERDKIIAVGAYSKEEMLAKIPWLHNSQEFAAF